MTRLLTTSQAAELVGVHRGTIHRWRRAGHLAPARHVVLTYNDRNDWSSPQFFFDPRDVRAAASNPPKKGRPRRSRASPSVEP